MTEEITLTSQDPTIFVMCEKCCTTRTSDGSFGNYYGSSFTKQEWKKAPRCPNCNGELTILRKIKVNR